jgi:hypothetical protein
VWRVLESCLAAWPVALLRRRKPGILVVMRALGVALVVLAAVAVPALARPQAQLGSDFADAYAEFAPFEALYRSFSDHLFAGAEVALPADLSAACARFLDALQVLHEELIAQTPAQTVEGLGALVRLRVASEGFCSAFSTALAALDGTGGLPTDMEASLVAQGFFASIHDLNEQFESALDAALRDAPNDEVRWVMAVTFAVRSLLVNPSWVRVSMDVASIFYGRTDAAAPPFDVPDSVRAAMDRIVAAAGVDLTDEERADIRMAAAVVYDDFIAGG